jgi:hypothetical protein
VQKRALHCLTRIEACASFFIIPRMSHVAQWVWEHRERTDDWTVSWLDVARDREAESFWCLENCTIQMLSNISLILYFEYCIA